MGAQKQSAEAERPISPASRDDRLRTSPELVHEVAVATRHALNRTACKHQEIDRASVHVELLKTEHDRLIDERRRRLRLGDSREERSTGQITIRVSFRFTCTATSTGTITITLTITSTITMQTREGDADGGIRGDQDANARERRWGTYGER
jgi:hypothetical protein